MMFFKILFTGLVMIFPQSWDSYESDADKIHVLFVDGGDAHQPALTFPIEAVDREHSTASWDTFTDPTGRTWGVWKLKDRTITLEAKGLKGKVETPDSLESIPRLSDLVDPKMDEDQLDKENLKKLNKSLGGRIELEGGLFYTQPQDLGLLEFKDARCPDETSAPCKACKSEKCAGLYAMHYRWAWNVFDHAKGTLVSEIKIVAKDCKGVEEHLTLQTYTGDLSEEFTPTTISISNLPAKEDWEHFRYFYDDEILVEKPANAPIPQEALVSGGGSGCMGILVTRTN